MRTSGDILANAERLLSDAEHLHSQGRSRSAATLIVVALEQMGAFVETLTKEKYPKATVHLGLFGNNANAHAKRQDALAAHVLNFAFGQFMLRVFSVRYARQRKPDDTENFIEWLIRTAPHDLTEEEQLEQKTCPDIATGHILLNAVHTNRLKDLREFGLYENANHEFSIAAIGQTLDLAKGVRSILAKSWVTPEVCRLAGINMPTGEKLEDF